MAVRKKRKRRKNPGAKGGQFERDFCRLLSQWFSQDPEETDLFWRSAGSGSRATTRARKGQKTRGHCGDICATDEVGTVLLKVVTIELKKGYNNALIHPSIDKSAKGPTQFEQFVLQAEAAAKRAGTPHWWLVHKRDYKEAVIYFPCAIPYWKVPFRPKAILSFFIKGKEYILCMTTLDEFFRKVSPTLFLNRSS